MSGDDEPDEGNNGSGGIPEGLPVKHDTPDDHVVLGYQIDIRLTPDWWEVILDVAGRYVRRMSTMEKPDEWLVRVELPKDRAVAFKTEIAEKWVEFVAKRKAEGNWDD